MIGGYISRLSLSGNTTPRPLWPGRVHDHTMQHRLVDRDARLAEYGLLQKPDLVPAALSTRHLGYALSCVCGKKELFWADVGCRSYEPKRCNPGGDQFRGHEQVVCRILTASQKCSCVKQVLK